MNSSPPLETTAVELSSSSKREKRCVSIILLFAVSTVMLFLLTNHETNRRNSDKNDIASRNKSSGHMLLCDDCCGDNFIDFDDWLSISPPNNEYKLLQSHYITRHGDRTQLFPSICWKQPYNEWICDDTQQTVSIQQAPLYGFSISPIHDTNILPGNCMIGQMTAKGYKQLLNHGYHMRQRYMSYYTLIPDTLDDNNLQAVLSAVRLRADDTQRVQQSIAAFFVGLYPDYNLLANRVTVPIFVEDRKYDIVISASEFVCPALQYIKEDRELAPEWIEFQREFAAPINDTIGFILGTANAGYYDAFDCGTAFLCHAYKAPINFTQELYDDAQDATLFDYLYKGIYPDYVNATKYHMGAFLKLIYSRFKAMINDEKQISSLYVYGGHDTGPIVPLLSAFQYNLTQWVPYAASITLELFQNIKNEKYFVLISYNGKSLEIPACQNSANLNYNLCEWNKFEKWMKDVTPTIEECPYMKLTKYLTQNV